MGNFRDTLGSAVPKKNADSSGRRGATKVNFGTKSALTAALMKPGRKTDSNPTSLQIRVSPLKKAVWYYRFRDKDGRLREGTLRYVAVATDGDGRVTLDYEQAKTEVARIKGDVAKSESERQEESDRTHFDTLEVGFPLFPANRITLKNEPLGAETKADYEEGVQPIPAEKPVG